MSTLIISYNTNKALLYIKKRIEEQEKIRVNIFNNIDVLCYNDNSLKLSTELIRDINIKLLNKSLNLTAKYLIISNFNRATPEAQNAFLKTLEESKAIIYLITNNKSGILDTVLSRVFEVNLLSKTAFNTQIQAILKNILINKEISLIKTLTTKYSLDKIIKNYEYFLKKHKSRFETKKIVSSVNKMYLLKKRTVEVKLNSEIQLTNIFLTLMKE